MSKEVPLFVEAGPEGFTLIAGATSHEVEAGAENYECSGHTPYESGAIASVVFGGRIFCAKMESADADKAIVFEVTGTEQIDGVELVEVDEDEDEDGDEDADEDADDGAETEDEDGEDEDEDDEDGNDGDQAA